jgi:hypothetical protein
LDKSEANHVQSVRLVQVLLFQQFTKAGGHFVRTRLRDVRDKLACVHFLFLPLGLTLRLAAGALACPYWNNERFTGLQTQRAEMQA